MSHIRDQLVRFVLGGNKANKLKRFLYSPVDRKKKRELIKSVNMAELRKGVREDKGSGEKLVIVSLTSYPDRFDSVVLALKSILLQDYMPDKIILWYDCEPNEITPQMHDLEQYGVEYRRVEGNLKSHKKYLWAMQQFPKSIIITIDDDLVYPQDTIRSLMECYHKHPDCVCARRVHKMLVKDETIQSYLRWSTEYMKSEKPSFYLCPTGAGGVLYPPDCLNAQAFDIEKIIKFCLDADDIWLKYMELLNGTKVVWAKNDMVRPPAIKDSQKLSLSKDNVLHGKNDLYIQNMNMLYGEKIKNVLDKYAK